MRAIKATIGAIIPLAVTVLYFALRGAFDDLWAWTITYNYGVFGPDANHGAIASLEHIWKVTRRILQGDAVIVLLSVIGLILFAAERIRAKLRDKQSFRSPDLFRDAILIPPIIYFGFCLINFQAGPDLIPFIPFLGIFAARFLLDAGRLVISHLRKARPSIVGRAVFIPQLAIGLLFSLVLVRAASYRMQGPALRDQDKAFKVISDLLGPDDKIYVHGTTEILVLLNKANMNPYLFLDWGADGFAALRKGVEFSALMDEMESQSPKIVALSRMKVVSHRDEFEKWVDDKYDELELELPGYTGVYLRKQQ
jgi:membrane protein CcdC involved in cytochrome C biogenesis